MVVADSEIMPTKNDRGKGFVRDGHFGSLRFLIYCRLARLSILRLTTCQRRAACRGLPALPAPNAADDVVSPRL